MSTTDAPTAQDSALLRLPGEIKNQIYREVYVKETTIPLCPKTSSSPGPAHMRCLSLGLPSMALVCREGYRDVTSLYFEENTFLFGDSVMAPVAVTAFERSCGAAAAKIRQLKVCHRPSHLCHPHMTVRFIAELTQSGVDVLAGPNLENILHAAKGFELAKTGRAYHEQSPGFCCCDVFELAHEYKAVPQEAGARNPLLDFLAAYARSAWERRTAFDLSEHQRFRSRNTKGKKVVCHRCGYAYYMMPYELSPLEMRNFHMSPAGSS